MLELRKFQTVRQKQGNGNAPLGVYRQPVVYLYGRPSASTDGTGYSYIHSSWGFLRCSFRRTRHCEGLNTWNGQQDWLHVFYVHWCNDLKTITPQPLGSPAAQTINVGNRHYALSCTLLCGTPYPASRQWRPRFFIAVVAKLNR